MPNARGSEDAVVVKNSPENQTLAIDNPRGPMVFRSRGLFTRIEHHLSTLEIPLTTAIPMPKVIPHPSKASSERCP